MVLVATASTSSVPKTSSLACLVAERRRSTRKIIANRIHTNIWTVCFLLEATSTKHIFRSGDGLSVLVLPAHSFPHGDWERGGERSPSYSWPRGVRTDGEEGVVQYPKTLCPQFFPLSSGRKRKEVATKFCQDQRVNPAYAGCGASVRCGVRTETTRMTGGQPGSGPTLSGGI